MSSGSPFEASASTSGSRAVRAAGASARVEADDLHDRIVPQHGDAGARSRGEGPVEDDVGAPAGCEVETAAGRQERLVRRLPVESHDERFEPGEGQGGDASRRGIDEPKPNPLVFDHLHHDGLACRSPGDGEDDVAVDLRRLQFVDEEHALEPGLGLRREAASHRRVVPESAGVLRDEAVVEGPARQDRVLRQPGDAVRAVRDSHSLPMDRSRARRTH